MGAAKSKPYPSSSSVSSLGGKADQNDGGRDRSSVEDSPSSTSAKRREQQPFALRNSQKGTGKSVPGKSEKPSPANNVAISSKVDHGRDNADVSRPPPPNAQRISPSRASPSTRKMNKAAKRSKTKDKRKKNKNKYDDGDKSSAAGNRARSFHETLVRERDKRSDFDDIYEVLEEIGHGGLCKIFKIRKKDEYIGGSSRPELVRKRKQPGRSILRVPPSPMATLRKVRNINSAASAPSLPALITEGRPEPLAYRDRCCSDDGSDSSTSSHGNGSGSSRSSGSISGTSGGMFSKMFFALKVINLALVKEDRIDQLKNEVEILKTLDHKNIIKAYETFQMKSTKKLMIVMELCNGGDLWARIPYTEPQAAYVTKQILSAISYMHYKNIAHRDIKFENIIFESNHPEAAVKVIDFGLSKEYSKSDNVLTERVGTLYSMAPETLQGIYTAQADLWSIGVCTFMMLAHGDKPFEGSRPKDLVAKILQGKYSFEGEAWGSISDEAKSFLRQLLVIDPNQRCTATSAMMLRWIMQVSSNPYAGLSPIDEEFKQRVTDNIARFADQGEFRKLALNVIAKKSTSDEIFELRRVFEEFDTLNTGTLTYEEFKAALSYFSYSEDDIHTIFCKVNVNRNNVINYTEFLAAALESQGMIEEYRLAEAFDHMDSDDSGYISRGNLRQILGEHSDEAYIDRLIAEADFKKDGRISYEEFLQVFSRSQQKEMMSIYESTSDGNFSSSSTEEVLKKHGLISTIRKKFGSGTGLSEKPGGKELQAKATL